MQTDFALHSSILDVGTVDTVVVLKPHSDSFLKEQAYELARLVDQLYLTGCCRFVIDLCGCEHISSDGLGAVAKCWRECHEERRGTMAVSLSYAKDNEVINLFDITGLTTIIGSALQSSVQDAVNYLREFA
jgi:anti-anti-sigma factor